MNNIEQKIQEAEAANHVASFVIPVKEGNIFLTERVKPPYKNFYCAIGGKRIFTESKIYETPQETVLREFCEEMYSGVVRPEQLRQHNLELEYLGFVFDEEFEFICHTSIACFDNALDFLLNENEVRRRKNLEQIKPENINPITQHMLERVRYMSFSNLLSKRYEGRDCLFSQIPHFSNEPPFDVPTKKYCKWEF